MNILFILVLSPMLIKASYGNYDQQTRDAQINAQYARSSSGSSGSGRGYVDHVDYTAKINSANGGSHQFGYSGNDGKISTVHHFEAHGTQGSSENNHGSYLGNQQSSRARSRYSRDQESSYIGHISERDGKITGRYYYDQEHGSQGQHRFGYEHNNQHISGDQSKRYRDNQERRGTYYEVHDDVNQSGNQHRHEHDVRGFQVQSNSRDQGQSNTAEYNGRNDKITGRYQGVKGQSRSGNDNTRISGSRSRQSEHNENSGKISRLHQENHETKGHNVRSVSHISKGSQAGCGQSSEASHSTNNRLENRRKVRSDSESSGQSYHQNKETRFHNVHHSRDHSQNSANGNDIGSRKTFVLKTGTSQQSSSAGAGNVHSSRNIGSSTGSRYINTNKRNSDQSESSSGEVRYSASISSNNVQVEAASHINENNRRTTTARSRFLRTTSHHEQPTRRVLIVKETTEVVPNSRTRIQNHQGGNTIETGRRRSHLHREHSRGSVSSSGSSSCGKFQVAYQWNYFNFTWTCPYKMQHMRYSPADYIPLSIAIYNNYMYMSFPRLRNNARVTLARMPLNSPRVNPVFTPYPSWEMNNGVTCESFQDVTKIEIDKNGIMWVLDGRRLNPSVNCPAKLYLVDLKQDGRIIRRYNIPEPFCPESGCLLNDIVVDGDYAFISDLTAGDEGIIVYNRLRNRSWKTRARGHSEVFHYRHDSCSPNLFKTDTSRVVAWIALAPPCTTRNRTFLYVPEEIPGAFGIDVDILKSQETATSDLSDHIYQMFSKNGSTGAAIYDSKSTLYVGLLSQKTIGIMKCGDTELSVCPRSNLIRYPGTFTFDNQDGSLYMTEMSSMDLSTTGVRTQEVNFKILKMKTNTKSYMYCDGRN